MDEEDKDCIESVGYEGQRYLTGFLEPQTPSPAASNRKMQSQLRELRRTMGWHFRLSNGIREALSHQPIIHSSVWFSLNSWPYISRIKGKPELICLFAHVP